MKMSYNIYSPSIRLLETLGPMHFLSTQIAGDKRDIILLPGFDTAMTLSNSQTAEKTSMPLFKCIAA